MPYGNKGGFSKGRSGGRSFGNGRDDRRGGGSRGGFGGGRTSRGRSFDRGPKEMFHAECAECGNDCEVPFKPTGEKPVLCSNCFDKSGGRERRDRAPRGDGGFKKEFRAPKPDARIDELLAEVRELHVKVDRLLAIIDPQPEPEPEPVKPKKTARIIPLKTDAVADLMKAKDELEDDEDVTFE